MNYRPISPRKQALIDAKNASKLKVGELVSVPKCKLDRYSNTNTDFVNCTVAAIDGMTVAVYEGSERDRKPHTQLHQINRTDIASRNLYIIGVNPFDESIDKTQPKEYSLESIIHDLNLFDEKKESDIEKPAVIEGMAVPKANWNPYIYDKHGKKQYYQRPLVWTIKDKQLLVESIYNYIDCGKIIVRKRGWDELTRMIQRGETEVAFKDIVDGKQRLNAVKSFMLDEFPDMQGNYYSDLSAASQRKFTDHKLFSYSEMPEDSTDEAVLHQFLKVNFTGVPQSEEHIKFVKSLQKIV